MRNLLIGLCALCLCASFLSAQRQQGGRAARFQEERRRALAWASENMPNLHRLVTEMPTRRRFTMAAFNRYRNINSSQVRNNPAVFEKVMKSIQAEDEIYGLVLELEDAPDDQKPAIREKIRLATSEMIQEMLQDRADWIAKLKSRVEHEERKLSEDRRNIDRLVEQRLRDRYTISPTTRQSTSEPQPRPSGPLAAPAGGE